MDQIDRCVPLDSVDANVLRKWGSAWLDLVHADSVLNARRGIPVIPANVFVRRALWESAVISYGRLGQSTQRRKIDLGALFAASGDSGASEFHDEIMRWRHGHVAHRADAAFESVKALLCVDGLGSPHALQLVVEPAIGPQDDENLVERFRAHVFLLRNTIWESFMAPLATTLAERAQRRPVGLEDSVPYPAPPAEGLAATLTLWASPDLTETA
jgi:hypothetical protein